ncbi:MAG: haloacid dehalogenase-like hydrolase [Bdellovibrio sp.]|nr:haloacid dehalogenase-like hydrolase [Bdellovibrio sp.]
MNYKAFPNEYWQNIEKTISELKAANQNLIAAFDADGTLWDVDLGENFFQYQIDHQQVLLPADPWNHYLEMKKVNDDPRPAYIWLAQINEGKSVEQVRTWAQAAFDSILPSPIFSEQKKLIGLLKNHGVKIYIVTASIKWAVEPGARALGLTNEQVIGVETAIKDGIITNQPALPVTYREGKMTALLKATDNQKPFFSAGNSIGDFELLQGATHLQLAVSAASRDDKLFRSENALLTKAKELGWWSHRFI